MYCIKPLFGVAFLATCLYLSGCSDKEYQSFEELDNANIREYIQKNNLDVSQYKNTDLFYEVLEEGTGNPIDYKKTYPVVYTVKSLDGVYNLGDTLSYNNRYADYFGYFPFGSGAAGTPTVERVGDFKEVIREVLKNTNGKIRIIVPSRLMYGRNGDRNRGIPPNASLDYVVSVHDNFEDFENGWVIPNMVKRAGLSLDDLTVTEDGIYYKIATQGTGDPISVDSTLTMNYTLKRPDGSTIESRSDYKTKLADLIPAWGKVIPLLNKGGKIRFFTPSTQAYGEAGSGSGIPPYASLDFEVEVKE
ncbi:FKBP-type peptidyl-prolyl cis-trans isomerase [Parapedobacter sp. GCM10030251]|uniref:FKBP-type peptidyl-prolyl cis-trans isomerase n=1 Tax=Parapedobacter sp. GCM10030251 TaxID=3273419 RepID=UPI00361F361B